MADKPVKIRDPYRGPIRALGRLKPASDLTTLQQAVAISAGLESWDHAENGDWRDALAVAARRGDLRVRNSYALLAQYLLNLDHRRAAEVGKLLEKYAGRQGRRIPAFVKGAGGLKAATAKNFVPPPLKGIRFRRKKAD